MLIYDFIIIGQGIAGSCLANYLLKQEAKFLIIDSPEKNNCSIVAAGLVNPITGKRPTKTWKAETLFPFSISFYKNLEQEHGIQLLHEKEIIRPATDIQQVNDTLGRISDGILGDYIKYEESNETLSKEVWGNYGFYKVNQGGYLDVPKFLELSRSLFKNNHSYLEDWIETEDVIYEKDQINVKGHITKNIIWSTGYYEAEENRFPELPFSLTRGEMMKFTSEKLTTNYIFNKNFFVVPRDGYFVSGATYSKNIKETISKNGKDTLMERLENLIIHPVQISEHYFGIRPTVKDRKPFVGQHPQHKNCYILNGLGSKGVTQGPYFAKELLNFISSSEKITKEVNINRYITDKN